MQKSVLSSCMDTNEFVNFQELDLLCNDVVQSLQKSGVNFMALDFDQTLISISTNHWNKCALTSNWLTKVNEAADKIRPVFRVLVPKLIVNDVCVAIVSFSEHDGLIKAVLEKGFGKYASLIPVRDNSGLKKTWEYRGSENPSGKQIYMASAAEYFHLNRQLSISKASTLLVDDDPVNVQTCLMESVRAVRLDPNNMGRFLQDLQDID